MCFFKFPPVSFKYLFFSVSPEQDEHHLAGIPQLDTGEASVLRADPATRTRSPVPQTEGGGAGGQLALGRGGVTAAVRTLGVSLSPSHTPASSRREGASDGRPSACGL